MAGYALFFDPKDPHLAQSPTWTSFLGWVQSYKCLDKVSEQVEGSHFIAAKLDAPCSLHKGITRDPQTGSWLMAVGTVIDPADIQPNGSLQQLLRDFQEKGAQVFSRLDGQFAIVAYHAIENSLNIISDPFGMIPVYYGQDGGQFYTSTSALAIARAIHSLPNDMQVRSLLLYGDTSDGSLWEGVRALKSATVLTLTAEGTREFTYWSFSYDHSIARLSLDDSVDCIIEGLSSAEKDFFRREGRFWVSLTGGLDSRTLAAITQHSGLPFKTYCHGPSDAKDVLLSAAISQKMGWEHEYYDLPADWGKERVGWLYRAFGQTDGHLDVLKVSRILREQTIKARQLNVSLWGYGGEIYRGYYWKQELWRTGKTSRVDYERLLNLRVIPLEASILKNGASWQQALYEAKKVQLREVGERKADFPNTVKLDLIGQYQEHHQGSNMIAGMLGQQRVLLPYYSKNNINRILSTNYKWRTHSRMFRQILERINPRLAAIETADGGPALSMRLTNAYKFFPYWFDTGEKLLWKLGRRFLGKSLWARPDAGPRGKAYPIEKWLKDTLVQLREYSLLNPGNMASSGLYDEKRLHELLESAERGNETLLGRIITVEMAFRAVSNEQS